MEAITINNLVAMVASIMALLGNRNGLEIVLDAVFQCTAIFLLVADGQVRQDVPRFNLTVIHMNSRHALLGTASIQRCQIRLFLSRTSGWITKDLKIVISKNNRRRIIEQSNLEIGDLWRDVLYKRISKWGGWIRETSSSLRGTTTVLLLGPVTSICCIYNSRKGVEPEGERILSVIVMFSKARYSMLQCIERGTQAMRGIVNNSLF